MADKYGYTGVRSVIRKLSIARNFCSKQVQTVPIYIINLITYLRPTEVEVALRGGNLGTVHQHEKET